MLVSPDEEPGAAGDAEPAVSLRSLLASLLLPCCGGVPGEPSAEEKLRQLKQSPLLRRARPQWWLLSTADHADGAEARQRRHLRVQRWLAAGAEHGTDSVDAADDAAAAAVAAGSCYASFAAGFVEEMTTDARHATLSGCGETLRELLSSAVHEGQLSAAAVAEFDAAFDAALKLYAAQPLRFLQTLRQGAGPARRGELREHYLTLAETGGGSEGGGGRGGAAEARTAVSATAIAVTVDATVARPLRKPGRPLVVLVPLVPLVLVASSSQRARTVGARCTRRASPRSRCRASTSRQSSCGTP